jgi:hypothetical protein
MKIGLIVYSQSGHTLEVCQTLRDRYVTAGHEAVVERVTVRGERTPQTKTFELDTLPDPSPYDAVVLASYVEAFSLCPVMRRYLSKIGSLEGKQAACLVTQQFPYPWMGGNRAVKQMKKLIQAKSGTVGTTAVVNWATPRRTATTSAALGRLAQAF